MRINRHSSTAACQPPLRCQPVDSVTESSSQRTAPSASQSAIFAFSAEKSKILGHFYNAHLLGWRISPAFQSLQVLHYLMNDILWPLSLRFVSRTCEQLCP